MQRTKAILKQARRMLLWSAAALALGLALALLNQHALLSSQTWVEHTLTVQRELNAVLNAALERQAGHRGYVITGEQQFLDAVRAADASARQHLAVLGQLVADNPAQVARGKELSARMGALIRTGDELIDVRRRDGFAAAQALVSAGAGRRAMDAVRGQIEEMNGEEARLLTLREARSDRQAELSLVLWVALFGGFVVVARLAYTVLRREVFARQMAESEMRASEQRFRSAINSSQDAFIILAAEHDVAGAIVDFRWIDANTRVRDFTGLARDSLLGKAVRATWPALAESYVWAHLVESCTARQSSEGEFPLLAAGRASPLWYAVSVEPVPDGIAVTLREVTERRRYMVALMEASGQLERSNRELQDFALVASHDLQEPLRKIRMFGDRLAEKYADSLGEEGRDYVRRMQNAAQRGQALIQGLLAYSRVATKGQPFTTVSLDAVAQEVVSDLEARIVETGAHIDLGPLPSLQADPLQMRQLLQNLLGNALKFQRKDVTPVIQVTALRTGAGWRLQVQDNGIGFEQKFADRIFKLFQRLHDRTAYEGTGMGLAICKRIVERHGGTISVESEPGQGTTFTLELPEQQASLENSAA